MPIKISLTFLVKGKINENLWLILGTLVPYCPLQIPSMRTKPKLQKCPELDPPFKKEFPLHSDP